jgi:drug/metabolite transporter (DMT)-like permease
MPRPGLSGFVLGTCAAACWGFGPVATKAALAGYSPEVVGVVRLGAAALCFRVLAGAGGRWWPDEPWLVLAGVALGLDFLLFTYGVQLTTAASAGLLVNFGQVANIVLARVVLGEALTPRRLIGAALTFAGVLMVATSGEETAGSGSLLGNVLIMIAGITWATYSVAQRRAARRSNVSQLLSPIFVVATLVAALSLGASGAWHDPGGARPTTMLLAAVAVSTVAPYLLYSHGQELLDVVVLTIVLASTPVFAVGLSWLLLGDVITWQMVAGGIVILGGIVVVALEHSRPKTASWVGEEPRV